MTWELIFNLFLIIFLFCIFNLNKTSYILRFSVIFFMVSFVYFIYLGFEFIALTFMIIYIRGIAVMFLFLILVLMLTVVKLTVDLDFYTSYSKFRKLLSFLNFVIIDDTVEWEILKVKVDAALHQTAVSLHFTFLIGVLVLLLYKKTLMGPHTTALYIAFNMFFSLWLIQDTFNPIVFQIINLYCNFVHFKFVTT